MNILRQPEINRMSQSARAAVVFVAAVLAMGFTAAKADADVVRLTSGSHLDLHPMDTGNARYGMEFNGLVYFAYTGGNMQGDTLGYLLRSDGTPWETWEVVAEWNSLITTPSQPTIANGAAFFKGRPPGRESELWKVDGSRAFYVYEPYNENDRGRAPHEIDELTEMNDILYFTAENGEELWRSDGKEEGTCAVNKTLRDIRYLTDVNGTLFFSADDGVHGEELWKSDGTPAGTVIVNDTWPGTNPSGLPYSGSADRLTAVGGTLFFVADDGDHGIELWKSDGTAAGTTMVKDIWPGENEWEYPCHGSPEDLTEVNGTLFFSASDEIHNSALWKSDGTAAGTEMVTDALIVYPETLRNVDGTLYFSATDGIHGIELWRSDGTEAGTVLVKDIHPTGDSRPSGFTGAGGFVYFAADDGIHGRELWMTDGTERGTVLVQDFAVGGGSSQPNRFYAASDGSLYFTTNSTSGRGELWVLSGPPGLAIDAGSNINGLVGSPIPLDGTAVYGQSPYTLTWSVDPGSPDLSSTQFSSIAVEDPTFTPTAGGVYTLKLSVQDGAQTVKEDTVAITITAPISVDAGPDAYAFPYQPVQLDATVSGGNGTYEFTWWVDPDGPADDSSDQFSLTSVEDPVFTPTTPGVYTLRVRVVDDHQTSAEDTVALTVEISSGGVDSAKIIAEVEDNRGLIEGNEALILAASEALTVEIDQNEAAIADLEAALVTSIEGIEMPEVSFDEVLLEIDENQALIEGIVIPEVSLDEVLGQIDENEAAIADASSTLNAALDYQQMMLMGTETVLGEKIVDARGAVDEARNALGDAVADNGALIADASEALAGQLDGLDADLETLATIQGGEFRGLESYIDSSVGATRFEIHNASEALAGQLDGLDIDLETLASTQGGEFRGLESYIDNSVGATRFEIHNTSAALGADHEALAGQLDGLDIDLETLASTQGGEFRGLESYLDNGVGATRFEIHNASEALATSIGEIGVDFMTSHVTVLDAINSSKIAIAVSEGALTDAFTAVRTALSDAIGDHDLSLAATEAALTVEIDANQADIAAAESALASAITANEVLIAAASETLAAAIGEVGGSFTSSKISLVGEINENEAAIVDAQDALVRAIAANGALLAALSATVDDQGAAHVDTEAALIGEIDQNEAAIAATGESLFAEIESSEVALRNQILALQTVVDGVDAKATYIADAVPTLDDKLNILMGQVEIVREEIIELHLASGTTSVLLMLPESQGGQLEQLSSLVLTRIAQAEQAGFDVKKAEQKFADGVSEYEDGDYKNAYEDFADAYKELTKKQKAGGKGK